MNSLYKEELAWLGDGSEGSTLNQNGNNLDITSKSTGTPYNVMLKADPEKASNYFIDVEITQLKGNIGVGAVRKDEFKPGWKAKGMFYNGNLTNGSGALKVSWGPRFSAGDRIGLMVTKGAAVDVTFYKNGECLGTGFRLAGNNATYYPCLHVTGSCSLSFHVPENLPSTTINAPVPTGFFGDWKLEEVWDGETAVPIPEGRTLSLNLSKAPKVGSIQFGFKIANSINGQALVKEETESSMTVETGPFMMTRMMPPPEYQPLESLIASKTITKVELEEDTKLTVSGPEIKVVCSRLNRTPETLTQY